MKNLSLRTRLFLSCFLVSALLFCGIFFYLKGYNRRLEETRAAQTFERAVSHYNSFRQERQQSLARAASLVANDSAFRKLHRPVNQTILAQEGQRVGADLVFLLDKQGNALASSRHELSALSEAVRPFFAEGASSADLSLLKLGRSLYQVALAPIGTDWVGFGIRLSGPQMDRLSGPTGLFHVLLRTKPAHVVEAGAYALSPEDLMKIEQASSSNASRVQLSQGNFLLKGISTSLDDTWRLMLLFPLGEFERASQELLEAFLVAGLVLLFLTTVFSHLLAREVTRPLQSLQARARAIAEKMGLDLPVGEGDEVQEIATSFLEVAGQMQTAYEHKNLALFELEAYRSDLQKANSNLQRRLFQLKVLLSLWSERDRALDVKDFLSRFLEVLLPGLPFEYGCVIIRPLVEMRAETIFAKKIEAARAEDNDELDGAARSTQWTDIIDPQVKDFLQRESTQCMQSQTVSVSSVVGRMHPSAAPTTITVVSLRLKQGEEPLGSLHFLTDQVSPMVHPSLQDFLLSLSAQVAAQLQIQALSGASRVDPLTRLYNEGYLNDRLREEVVRTSRTNQPFTLLLLDIDRFAHLREEHGQRATDEVLRAVSALLKKICRGSDTVCRFSGARMGVLLADTALQGGKIFAENLRKAVEAETFSTSAGPLKITVSQGLAEHPSHGEAPLARAEEALLAAQDQGRGVWKAAA